MAHFGCVPCLLIADQLASVLVRRQNTINKLLSFRNTALRISNNKNMRLLFIVRQVPLHQYLASTLHLHLLLTHTARPYQKSEVVHSVLTGQSDPS